MSRTKRDVYVLGFDAGAAQMGDLGGSVNRASKKDTAEIVVKVSMYLDLL